MTRSPAVLERGRGQGPRSSTFVEGAAEAGGPGRAAGGARRRVRQRRHAVVREADAGRARLHPRAARGDGRARRVAARPPAVEGRVRARPPLAGRRHHEALPRRRQRREGADGRPASRRSPNWSVDDYDGRRLRVPATRRATRRSGAGCATAATGRWWSCSSTSRPAASPTYIASGGDRDFMRPVTERSTTSRPSGWWAARTRCATSRTSTAARVVYQARAGRLRRRPGQARADLEPDRAPAARWPPATPTAIWRCWGSPAARRGPALRLLILHDDAEREFDYTAGAERVARAGRGAGLDRRQRQGRLGDRLRGPAPG